MSNVKTDSVVRSCPKKEGNMYMIHVLARGLETAQAVTPFFNMRCIGSLGLGGGVGWGC